MALSQDFDQSAGTVQFLHKGWPITPKMKLDDPKELLDGLTQALEVAYQKLHDANLDSN
jgi:hypothetical protein